MSTLKVTNIESPSGGGVNAKITDINGGQLSNRNLLINGAMQVRQRSDVTGATVTQYVLDRFQFIINTMGSFSISRSTEAPAGFSNSIKVDCTTADASPAAGDFILLGQKIEGQNLQHLDFGSSSAKQLTYSFWVRSPKTGTHILEFFQDGNSTQVSATYTVNTVNTWEHKEVTIDGDTASALANDESSELAVYHWLGGGSDFTSGTLNTSGFAAVTNANRAVGTINIADSTSNEFYLTGAQLEVGNVATAFEHRSYADELFRCKRYYHISSPRYMAAQFLISNEICSQFVPFIPEMRATPSPTYGSLSYRENTGSFGSSTLSSNATLNKNGINFVMDATGAATSDSFVIFMNQGEFAAEL